MAKAQQYSMAHNYVEDCKELARRLRKLKRSDGKPLYEKVHVRRAHHPLYRNDAKIWVVWNTED